MQNKVKFLPILIAFMATSSLKANELRHSLFVPDTMSVAKSYSMMPFRYGNAFVQSDETKYEMKLAPNINWQQISGQAKPKSKGRAFMLSLLLPGLGERYVGANTKSQVFLGTEILLWAGYAGFRAYSNWRKEDYRTYAATYAGVKINGKLDSYFTDLENYSDIYEYNEAMLRDRNLNDYYRDVQQYYWQWDNISNRETFKDLRISADQAYNRSLFVIAAIVANHIISAIDAMWTVHRYNSGLDSFGLNFNARYSGLNGDRGLSLHIAKAF